MSRLSVDLPLRLFKSFCNRFSIILQDNSESHLNSVCKNVTQNYKTLIRCAQVHVKLVVREMFNGKYDLSSLHYELRKRFYRPMKDLIK